MLEVGRLCVKIAGREAGKKCIIVDAVDDNFVMIDGNVRRKRCSISHLEPLGETLEIKKGASRQEIEEAFKKAGILEEKKKVTRKEKPAKAEKAEKAEKTKKEEPIQKKKKAVKKKEAKKEAAPNA